MADITDFIPPKKVPEFFKKQRTIITGFLMKHYYNVTPKRAEEAFENGCLAMFENMHKGKLTKETLRHELSSYLTECCKRQLLKEFPECAARKGNGEEPAKEKSRRTFEDIDSISLHKELEDHFEEEDRKGRTMLRRKEDLEIVLGIVRDMPSPCNELIFGRYYGHESMEFMAEAYGITNANNAKQTLRRCLQKVRKRFFELRKE